MSVTQGDVQHYAIRRVNPFLGVMQVIATDGGRALSTNGVSWSLELPAERRVGWGSLNRNNYETAYCVYGMWSAAEGLVCLPLSPLLDSTVLRQQADQLIGLVEHYAAELPFPLQDDRELWLFEAAEQRPLALLATAVADAAGTAGRPRSWSACPAGGLPGQRAFPAADSLQQRVQQRAGANPVSHWIVRDNAGAGRIDGSDDVLDAALFPVMLLREDWEDRADRELVRDYLHWIAPALLTLQHLQDDDRMRLEPLLQAQSLSIEHHWRLFPKIIDPGAVKAARTVNRLQRASGAHTPQ
jgi:hypothetical protein